MTETKQALDAVVALVDGWRRKADKQQATAECDGSSPEEREWHQGKAEGLDACADDLAALLPALTAYIHRIQTSHPSYDNAVRIRQLEEQVEQLQAALGEAEANDRRYRWLADNCFNNKYAERDHPHAIIQICVGSDGKSVGWMHPGHTRHVGVPTLDLAVDAAIDAMAAGEDAK